MLELKKLDLTNYRHSLDDFRENADDLLREMKSSGQPLVLTKSGKATAVVLTAKSFEEMLQRLDRLETMDSIAQSLKDVEEGRTQPANEALEEIRQKILKRRKP